MNIKKDHKNNLLLKAGKICFSFGILILPGAFFYSSILLLISFIIANIYTKNNLKDKWNLPLIICSILMILICLISNFYPSTDLDFKYDNNLNWIGLLNWIPMFWVFWTAQYYLKTIQERINCAFYLLIGTIPILIAGFGQYYLNWYGPFKFFNDTIIWYQRENIVGMKGMTGLFNNPNYTACALATVFPILCATFFSNKYLNFRKIRHFSF